MPQGAIIADLKTDSIRDDRQQRGVLLVRFNVGPDFSTGWRLSLIGFAMHHYKHHIGDYRRDTMHLSLLEHGAYRQLMDMYYLSESPIPKETELVFRRLCAKTDQEQEAVLTVLNEFFDLDETVGWIHKRCSSEIQKYTDNAEIAKENGKLGGRPKKTSPVISGFQKETGTKANHKPITNNHKPVLTTTADAKAPSAAAYKIQFDYSLGQWNGISEDDASAWGSAYPALDIDSELFRAAEWAKANPANRKNNWRRFLTNWFSRAQERAPRRAA